MKKIFSVLLMMIVMLTGMSCGHALEVEQYGLEIKQKSDTTIVTDDSDLKIAPKITFNKIGDYITYKITLKNTDGKKYKIVSVTDNNPNESVKVTYEFNKDLNADDKEILMTLTYDKVPTKPNETLKDIKLIIKLVDEENNTQDLTTSDSNIEIVNNPKTGDHIKSYLWLLTISVVGLGITTVYLIRSKKYGKAILGILIMFTLVPTIVFATTTIELMIDISFDNIKIDLTHEVVLYYDNGLTPKTEKVEHDKKLIKPADPTREGYDFVKWVDESDKEFDFTTAITRDYKLKAKWKKKEYVVNFDSGIGVIETNSTKVEYGEKVGALPVPTVPTGYTFDGWYVNNEKVNANYIITKSETLVAKYTAIEYSITYYLGEGTVDGDNPTTYTVDTNPFTIINPTREGYKFVGWVGSNGETPQTTILVNKGTTGNLVYVATWKKLYTVTLDLAGGVLNAPLTIVVEEGEEIGALPTPTRGTDDFMCWYYNPAYACVGVNYSNYVVRSDMTLVANYGLIHEVEIEDEE